MNIPKLDLLNCTGSRTQNSIRNIMVSVAMQMTLLVLSFISRTIFIRLLGEDYLGISDLYSNILSILSLSDLGINTVMIYSLYKPLVNKDNETVAKLLCFFKRVYNGIAIVVFCLGMVSVPFLQYIVKESNLTLNQLRLYFILFLVNTAISYLNVYKSTLINAEQKMYIIKMVDFFASTFLSVGQIVVLYFTKNYVFFLLLSIAITIIKNIVLSIISERRYPFLREVKSDEISLSLKMQIVQNTRSNFIYRVSAAIMNSTDNILISMILGTVIVGYYSNYSMIITAINSFIMLVAQSLLASIGNLNATDDSRRKLLVFKSLMLLFWGIATFCVCCFLSMFNDFISIWLTDYDTRYILPYRDVIAISINFFFGCILTPIWMYRETSGLFNQVKYSMTVAAIINIFLSIILGKWIGLSGIILATAISKILTNFWYEPRILFSYVFEASSHMYWIKVIRYTCCTLLSVGVVLLISSLIPTCIWGIIIKIFLSFIVSVFVYMCVNANTEEEQYILRTFSNLCGNRRY